MKSNSDQEKVKVVYCMGSGRSGSTLLGILLNLHSDVVSPGEISNVGRFRRGKRPCSCGNNVHTCSYWSSIMENWEKLNTHESVNRTIEKGLKIENFKSPRAWFKIIFNYPFQTQYFENYLQGKYNFFKAIKEESGKDIVVDISKNPLRAYVLSKHPDIDLRIIHLVRDGRGVSYSIMKKSNRKQKPFWRAALYWVVINRISNFICKKTKNSGLIRYEDLITQPNETLNEISNIIDVNLQTVMEKAELNLAQDESHIMAGNILRKSKSIKLKLDTEWQQKMNPKQLKSFRIMARNTLKKYGYALRV